MTRIPSLSVATPTPKLPNVSAAASNFADALDDTAEFIVKPFDAPHEQPSQPLLMNLMQAAPPPPKAPVDGFGQPLTLADLEVDPWAGIDADSDINYTLGPGEDITDGSWATPSGWHSTDPWAGTDRGLPEGVRIVPLDDEYLKNRGSAWQGDPLPDSGRGMVARDEGEDMRSYLARLKALSEIQGQREARDVVRNAVLKVETDLARDLDAGKVSQDYLDYLGFHGVDARTIADVESGDLPMDRGSRRDRAEQMGLDPMIAWTRWDYPLKNEMVGFSGAGLSGKQFKRYARGERAGLTPKARQEGLVYTHFDDTRGLLGVQMPRTYVSRYPLYGPAEGIAGLDALPKDAEDAFYATRYKTMQPHYQAIYGPKGFIDPDRMVAKKLADASLPRPAGKSRDGVIAPMVLGGEPNVHDAPTFSLAENRKEFTEPLMASGATGTMVSDETGVSTAFTPKGARQLRRADLAPLDPRFRASRNILQGLLVPVAIGAAAGQEDR